MSEPTASDVLALLTPDMLALLTPEQRALVDDYLGALPPPGLLSEDHVWQTRMIRDPARFKTVLCNRRAGKSFGIAAMLLADGWSHPNSNYLYAGMTLDSAKKAIWKDTLKVLDARLSLGLRFNEAANTCTLPNGAVIYVIGMDSTDQQRRKARGGKYRIAVADEAQDFISDLDDLVQSILMPAVSDEQGTVVLSGTPGQVPVGLFYRLTKDACAEKPGRWQTRDIDTATDWVGYTWSAADNPYMREQFTADVARMIEVNPLIVETPKFKREWRGMWVTDDERRVYLYAPGRNDYDELPKYQHGQWHRVLGVDLGFNDDTALTVIAWHDHDPCAYIESSESEPGLDITDVAHWIREVQERDKIESIVVDGANKQAVEEFRRRHNLPLIAADKRGKAEFIDIMNAEFIKGNIKLSRDCDGLRVEYAHLTWEERAWNKKIRREDPRAANHKADSGAYAYRLAYAYLYSTIETKPKYGTPEFWKADAEESLRRSIEANRREEDDLEWLW